MIPIEIMTSNGRGKLLRNLTMSVTPAMMEVPKMLHSSLASSTEPVIDNNQPQIFLTEYLPILLIIPHAN